MFNLVYKSKATLPFEDPQIQSMLERLSDFNRSKNITGCLLYYNGIFLHYLEGDLDEVVALFEGIKKDNRQSQVTVLSTTHIHTREFETWNMAYENFNGSNHQLAYLKLMVSLFNKPTNQNITSRRFWAAVKKLLKSRLLK